MCKVMPSLVLFLFATCLPTVWLVEQKALDEFVNRPDPHYNYTFLKREAMPFWINFDTINLTSQKWPDQPEVDKPVWSHNLTIVVPRNRAPRKSFLLILRSDESDESSSSDYSYRLLIHSTSLRQKSIVALLRPLPNQALTFYDHPLNRKNITGYDIIAYSWWKFLNDPTASPHWLAQFPMVKATVRAMDTIIAYVKNKYRYTITNFTLTGISTGGWISWLTAAVDKRVDAIVPIGMDFLNFTESFHHQYRAYCGWSYKLRPFYVMNITQKLDNPRFRELANHVDPLAYNERYKNVSKYIIVLSGDGLFQPDNSRYYFSQLEGVKYLRIIPNSDYGTIPEHQFGEYMIIFFFRMLEKKFGLPKVSWEIKKTNTSGTIILHTYNEYYVYFYHADILGTRRDFRMRIASGNSSKENSVKWIRSEVATLEKHVYKAEMQNPNKGWKAFFIEAIYPQDPSGYQLKITSEMVILPGTFPCPDCSGDKCRGKLV